MQEIQNTHLTFAYQSLQRMKEEDDPFIYGQAHHYLALGALYTQATSTAIAYHEEAVKIVERNGLQILRSTGHMISDPAHLEASGVLERAVFLGTLLHTEIMLDMFGAKKRSLCYTIEDEFRYRFPVRMTLFDRSHLGVETFRLEGIPASLPGFPIDLESPECASCEGSIRCH